MERKISVRLILSDDEKKAFDKAAKASGFRSAGPWIRAIAVQAAKKT